MVNNNKKTFKCPVTGRIKAPVVLNDREIPGVKTLIKTNLNGPLEGLLNVQPLAHDGLVQLPLKSQQIHVSLRLWDQFPDLGHNKRHW